MSARTITFCLAVPEAYDYVGCMSDEAESLTLRILQEMRSDMRDLKTGLEEVRSEMHEMRTDLTQRIDGNTMILNLIAGVTHDHEQRITDLGNRQATTNPVESSLHQPR